ncbi:MAG: DUF763 domain-containing protein [Chitinophagales bacterium]|nr:DUF763 domain-containing protein [Chitinophagales bacterium]
MPRSGYADLPLHYGHVPVWLAERMKKLGGAIVEAIALEYGISAVVQRFSDPFWFQSLGCVLGMDWHSSGVTTSVMGALKKAINPISHELGIYICGGKGKYSRQTPEELVRIADKTGMNGNYLINCSKLSAKVDNTAIQDGFHLYLHSFIVTRDGDWTVVQQGLNDKSSMARRYHWHSTSVKSFVDSPHTFIYGKNQGLILNLTDPKASGTRDSLVKIAIEDPVQSLPEIKKLLMPCYHDVRAADVNIKRLGSVLALAHEKEVQNFESLLMLQGLGPRTLQSLTLVSEVIHGTPSRFSDPARFSFAHGGKDGHPFPVPVKVYDETIDELRQAVNKAKIGSNEKTHAIKSLAHLAQRIEKDFVPNQNLSAVIKKEKEDSWKYGGRTVFGKVMPPQGNNNEQLKLF